VSRGPTRTLPALPSKETLLKKILSAIEVSGWTANVMDRNHPFRILVSHDGISLELRIYIWNITPGAGTRPRDEFRIQITGVREIKTGTWFRTLLLGWDTRYGVFAGWNASRYERPYTPDESPALQIKNGTLSGAKRTGMAIQPKIIHERGNVNEVVVAFRPDLFGAYFTNLDNYHQPRLTRLEANLLARVGTNRPPTDEELASLSEERRHVIREVEQAVRNVKFRKLVLSAYNYSCGVCGLDLGIVQAAHIVPVAEQGTDEPSNGIALCANHHRAFDKNILMIKDDYTISVNTSKQGSISASEFNKIIGGITKLQVPTDRRFAPNPEYLSSRMRIFGTPQSPRRRRR